MTSAIVDKQKDRAERRLLNFENLTKTLKAYCPPSSFVGGTLLDFGSGPADSSYIGLYAPSFARAIGTDVLDYTDTYRDTGMEFRVTDGATIDLPDATCDLVVSHSVLEHVADLDKSLSEIHRVLKPGAVAFLTVSPLYFAARGAHVHTLDDWGHLRPDSPFYLLSEPLDRLGAHLNHLTMTKMSAAMFKLPWTVSHLETRLGRSDVPVDIVKAFPLHDLIVREFRAILRKV